MIEIKVWSKPTHRTTGLFFNYKVVFPKSKNLASHFACYVDLNYYVLPAFKEIDILVNMFLSLVFQKIFLKSFL